MSAPSSVSSTSSHTAYTCPIGDLRPYFCETYSELKTQLTEVVQRVRDKGIAPVVEWSAENIAERGSRGDELWIDFIYVGPDPKNSIIDVIQVDAGGIHGVEAPASSAQVLYNLDHLEQLPPNTGYLFIPCQNPFGLDHQRRCDGGNVDLNRNYAYYENGELPSGAWYNQVDSLLNPTSDNRWCYGVTFWTRAVYLLLRRGVQACYQGIIQGQGKDTQPMNPKGILYPGTELRQSSQILISFLETFFSSCEFGKNPRFYLIDHHTGLGRIDEDRDVLLCHCPEESGAHEQLRRAIPDSRTLVQDPDVTSSQMNRAFERLVAKILKTKEVAGDCFVLLQEIPTGAGSTGWKLHLLRKTIEENYYDQQVRFQGDTLAPSVRDLSEERVKAYRDCFFRKEDEAWLRRTIVAGNDAFKNIQNVGFDGKLDVLH